MIPSSSRWKCIPIQLIIVGAIACHRGASPVRDAMNAAQLTVRVVSADDTLSRMATVRVWVLPTARTSMRDAIAHERSDTSGSVTLKSIVPGSYVVLVGSLAFHYQHIPLVLSTCSDTLVVMMPRDRSDLGREPLRRGWWRQRGCA